jgi:hypothetical protein
MPHLHGGRSTELVVPILSRLLDGRALKWRQSEVWVALAELSVLGLVLSFFLLAAFVAIVVPYHSWDALAYGEWSRLIAATGHFRFSSITDQTYHRPLFYVLQGWLWRVVGFSESYGRLVSLAFSLLLAGAVGLLAAQGPWRRVQWICALGILIAVPDFATEAIAGLTDVPVAACVAAAAAALWVGTPSAGRSGLVVLAAAAAVLAKPSAVVALVGLCMAHALGARSGLRARILSGVVPICVGAGAALAYDGIQAHAMGEGFLPFLRAGSTGYYSELARHARREAFFDFAWFGSSLRLLILFGLAYGVSRALLTSHRHAVLVAWPTAVSGSILGPLVAAHESTLRVGPLASIGSLAGFVAVALMLLMSLRCPEELAPVRLGIQRVVLWAVPPLVVWVVAAGYDSRLLSPAWPPLILLLASALTTTAIGAASVKPALTAVPLVAVFALALLNLHHLDGLGHESWVQLRGLREQIFDQEATRAVVLPGFAQTLRAVRSEVGADGRVFSSDGRFRFYLPGRVTQYYPSKCADLAGYRAFVLLTDPSSTSYLEQNFHVPAASGYWARCTKPRLTKLLEVPGYAAFRVGT